MRILVVSTRFPYPPRWGFATRVYQLARLLARRDQVTLLCPAEGVEPADVELLRAELEVEIVERAGGTAARSKRATQLASLAGGRSFHLREFEGPELQDALARLCSERRFDVVQLESSLLGELEIPAGPAVVLDEHNVEYEVFERMSEGERSPLRRAFYRLESSRFRPFEQRLWRAVDGCAVTSPRDAREVEAHAPETAVAVVPNGVDVDYFRPVARRVEPRSLVFNGVLDYRPNLDGAWFLVDEIMPRLRARFPDVSATIVGRGAQADLARLRRAGAQVTGEVPDVRPHLASAAVVVVPLRIGGGTRLKVVEGLALGRPMVTTALGCEGIDVVDGEHLLVRDDPEQFAAGVESLFADPDLGQRLGATGRRLMESAYSWEAAASRLRSLHEHVRLDDRSSPPSRPPAAVAGR
ncbi:MAG TPA: glycosyltransferase family 4 protein [Gaiellaceae bacterium]|nr:glycosyltransferase family 4 protein [Gaiellaceae bacterium]